MPRTFEKLRLRLKPLLLFGSRCEPAVDVRPRDLVSAASGHDSDVPPGNAE